MKIFLASDLHLDIAPLPESKIEKLGGVLLLAGDTAETRSYHKPRTKEDLQKISDAFDQVFLIPGNHEYYTTDILTAEDEIREVLKEFPNMQLLQGESVKVENITIIAATLWTPEPANPEVKVYGSFLLNDYKVIRNGERKLTIEDTASINYDHLNIIDRELVKTSTEKCIIMTHHAPILSHGTGHRHGDPYIDAFYTSNLEDYIMDYCKNVQYWVHGHTHDVKSTKVGETLVATNARGYTRTPLSVIELNV